MSDTHLAALHELNRHYIRAVGEADVAWFERHLAPDFLNTNPDGTLVDRTAFLAQIGRGPGISGLQAHDVRIRLFDDFAVIHARTSYRKADGSPGGGRYTDDWQLRPEGWRCVSAHVSRS